jgi:SAM-dependent methyltransferase
MLSRTYILMSRCAKWALPERLQEVIRRALNVVRDRRRAAAVRGLVRITEWEEPLCLLCGSYDVTPHKTYNGFRIVRCRRDGLIFASPRPRDVRPFYDERYYRGEMICGYHDYDAHAQDSMGEWDARLVVLERNLPQMGKLLDVGCATGVFLDRARARGWEVEGIEVASWAVKIAAERYALRVLEGTLPDRRFPSERYDVATLFDCIEHLSRPNEVLADVWRVLRPGGFVLLSTGAVPHGDPDLRSTWYYPPWHLYYFSQATICALLGAAGFDVVSYTENQAVPGSELMIVLARKPLAEPRGGE